MTLTLSCNLDVSTRPRFFSNQRNYEGEFLADIWTSFQLTRHVNNTRTHISVKGIIQYSICILQYILYC